MVKQDESAVLFDVLAAIGCIVCFCLIVFALVHVNKLSNERRRDKVWAIPVFPVAEPAIPTAQEVYK